MEINTLNFSKEEVFVIETKVSLATVKRYYRKLFPNPICEQCSISNTYNGCKFTMHIDHINGDSKDHRLDNLRYLCPNCHSQTENFCWKNVKRK